MMYSAKLRSRLNVDSLVGRVIQEDEGNHTMCGCCYTLLAVNGKTYRLRGEGQEHS